MKKKALRFAAATVLAFLGVAALLDRLLSLAGSDRWLLWGGLVVLGGVAAVLVYLHLAPRGPAAPAATDGEVELRLDEARRRLAASGVKPARLDQLPVVVLLGPTGSAKTSTVLHSGTEPDLLAGEVHRGELVAPTASVNVWYTRSAVLVEAGGALPGDAVRWPRLLRQLRPGRLAAALGRGGQAPRLAVVCYSCEELVRPGSAEATPAAAARLRTALAELSRELGVRLPVYVLFTKADRLPYFEEYVRTLSRPESQEVLGATLPLAEVAPGAYADHQAARLAEAFDGIYRSLARWRLQVLPREATETARAGAYEFPREMRKLSEAASRFLLDLCRPSQLGVNPFLRGFYFTGVRPVVVEDAVASPAAGAPQGGIALGATGVFRLPSPGAVPAAPVPSGRTRRVPEWVFLRRILPELVMQDRTAMAVTSGGARVDGLRRALAGAAAVLFLALGVGFAVSYANNRALTTEALAATRAVEPVRAAVGEPPSAADLRRLEGLRALLDRLGVLQREGRPLRYAWGLYTGSALHEGLRPLYFDRFGLLIWDGARADLAAALRQVPEAPGQTAEFDSVYSALKAYLITTSHPRESTPGFLTPVLLGHWRQARGLDVERQELAKRQLDFFAAELPRGDPFPDAPEEALVLGTRRFLQQFTGVEALYHALLADAAGTSAGVQFNRLYPGSEAVLRNGFTVSAAFTREGWERVQRSLADVDRLLSREDWVLGERSSVAAADRARLAAALRERYVGDYVSAWSEYLRSSTVVGYAGPEDAARRLAVLSGNESPLLQLLALAARHTAVDTLVVARAFQPVHAVVPAGESDRFVSEANAPYVDALVALQSSMDQVAKASGPERLNALAAAGASAEQANVQVRQLAQSFSVQGRARETSGLVQRLLNAPITGADALVQRLPTAEANAQGTAFCRPIRQLAAKYPFAPRAADEANMEEVAAVLQPGTSALWAFYDEALQELLARQGNRYAARVGADPQPTAAFVTFFNQAAEISTALFPEEGAGPRAVFAFAPQTTTALSEVRLTVDGQTQTFTRTNAAAKTFVWEGERARSARLAGQVNGAPVTLVEVPDGPWALFRLLQQAEWERTGADRFRLRWTLPSEPGSVTAEITFADGRPVFMPGYLSRLDCVSQIVR